MRRAQQIHTNRRTRALSALLAGVLTIGTVGAIGAAPSGAAPAPVFDGACEGELLALHNQARARNGLPALREDPRFNQVTRAWASELARSGSLRHNPSYANQIGKVVTDWQEMGENVGYGPDGAWLHAAYMDSPPHRANILSSRYQRVAVGCYRDGYGRAWTAVNFVRAQSTVASRSYAPFASSGQAVGQLREWLLAAPPSSSAVEADGDALLWGSKSVPVYAADLASSSTHVATVPQTTRLYYAVFLRNPDAPGLSYWIKRRRTDLGLERMANGFVGAPEFQQRYGSLDDGEFVDRVYLNVLGRTPDAPGRAYWTSKLRDGITRGKLIIGFSESPEYQEKTYTDVTVSWAAIQLLGRVPTDGERATWSDLLEGGTTPRQLVASIVQSPEVRARAQSDG